MTDRDEPSLEGNRPDDDLVAHDSIASPGRRLPPALVVLGAAAVAAVVVALVLGGGDRPEGGLQQGGDLGALSDPVALSERVAPGLSAPENGTATIPASQRPACASSSSALPDDGADLVYTAQVEWEGTPAVVLGYRVDETSLQRILLVMAEDDCRLLVTQSF